MTRLRALCAVAMLAALVSVANAQTVHFAAAGSSAMFQGFAVSTVNLVAPATLGGSGATSIHHYTFNSANCPGVGCPAVLRDPRVNASAPPISDEPANIWVVWTCVSAACSGLDAKDIWFYDSVDSTVGVRSVLSRDVSGVGSAVFNVFTPAGNPGGDKITPNLFQFGVANGNATCTGAFGTNIPMASVALDGSGNAIYTFSAAQPSGVSNGLAGGTVTVTGFVNGGNNVVGAAITASTSTTLTVVATTQVAETHGATGAIAGVGIKDHTKTCDDPQPPADVTAAINNFKINVGMTDIRPEDAKAATKRSAGPVTNNVSLGYGTVGSQLVTNAIQSFYSITKASPVEFGLPGLPDPFNNVTVPFTMQVFPVGEDPILFVANRQNANGLGAVVAGKPVYANLDDTGVNALAALFSGQDCSGKNVAFQTAAGANSFTTSGLASNFPVTLVIREPLSGTMNTTEWNEFRTAINCAPGTPTGAGANCTDPYVRPANTAGGYSQEFALSAISNNPVNVNCTANADGTTGLRRRAIGTGQVRDTVAANKDHLGYLFFSFANTTALSGKGGYLAIDGVEPIFTSYTVANGFGQPAAAYGNVPLCVPGLNCDEVSLWGSGNPAFPHLQDGSYRAWSLLRMICDTATPHCLSSSDPSGAQAIVALAQNDIISASTFSVADYLPLPQAQYVRAHYQLLGGTHHALPFVHFFTQPVVPPVAGNDTLDLGSSAETTGFANGGDAGGCIIPIAAGAIGSNGKHANDTAIKITQASSIGGANITYTYSNVAGTTLAALAGLGGGNVQVTITGFNQAGKGQYDGVYTIVGGSVTATTFKVAKVVASNTTAIAPTGPNGSAGNGSVAVNAAVQCYQ